MNVVVTLVHGTWGRGFLAAHCKRIQRHASWTEEGAPLVAAIRRSLGLSVLITCFDWSGRNSHRARLEAAEELTKHLTDLVEQYPHATHAIVAHSHGGNVALYALRKNRLAARMRAVVCMATPFVIIRRREWAPASVALLVTVATLFHLALPMVFMASVFLLPTGPTMRNVVLAVSIAVLIVGMFVRAQDLGKAGARRSHRLYRDACACRLGERLVIVRAPGDEASLALAASALIERLGRMSVGALQRFTVPLVLVLIGLVRLVMTLGPPTLVLFIASSLLGRPQLMGGMSFEDFALPAALVQVGGLVAATGLAAALAVPPILSMFVGGAAFGLDAGLLSPWLVSRAEESPSGKERVRRFESRPDRPARKFIEELCTTDAFGLSKKRFRVRLMEYGRRPDSLAHTAIHDDPCVVDFVASAIARIGARVDPPRE